MVKKSFLYSIVISVIIITVLLLILKVNINNNNTDFNITYFNITDFNKTEETLNYDFYAINEINTNYLETGKYLTSGYIIGIEPCICDAPPGAVCERCDPFIFISEENDPDDAWQLRSPKKIELVVDLQRQGKDQFEIGKEYDFVISIVHYEHDETINYAVLESISQIN